MNAWRIVCIKQQEVMGPPPHVHVIGVGTGDRPDWADMRWELDQVHAARAAGEEFYTQSSSTGRRWPIQSYICPHCQQLNLRSVLESDPDALLQQFRGCIYT